jgi:hypothetical protein
MIAKKCFLLGLMAMFAAAIGVSTPASAQQQWPNIVFIMGDDIGWSNIGAYHRGLMASRTPRRSSKTENC